MANAKKSRVSGKQIEVLLQFMEQNKELSEGKLNINFTKHDRKRKWSELVNVLNAEGGAVKTEEQWRKCWNDQKSYTRAKGAKLSNSMRGTGGGPTCETLTDIEERMLNISGWVSATGDASVPEGGIPMSSEVGKVEQMTPIQQEIEDTPVIKKCKRVRDRRRILPETQKAVAEFKSIIEHQYQHLDLIASASIRRAEEAEKQTEILKQQLIVSNKRAEEAERQTDLLQNILKSLIESKSCK